MSTYFLQKQFVKLLSKKTKKIYCFFAFLVNKIHYRAIIIKNTVILYHFLLLCQASIAKYIRKIIQKYKYLYNKLIKVTKFYTLKRAKSPVNKSKMTKSLSFLFGGDNGARTRDLLTASQALSQLSYTPKCLLL